jgi:hypothetical protein
MKIALSLALLSALLAGHAQAAGLRSERTVLRGALIRAGGPGGQQDLPVDVINDLCERGISKAYYLYPSKNFRNKGVHSCSRGSMTYTGAGFQGRSVAPILADVARAATNGGGPVLVHCWNGWHAAGEVSAYALVQLCDWSGDRAAQYWASNIADKRNVSKYGSVLKRIRNFKPFAGIRISDGVKARVCP